MQQHHPRAKPWKIALSHRDTEPLKGRKEPTQQRSKDLVEAILQAATRILREGEPDALTIAELCRVAGVSPGSLYQYFPTKDAVIYALMRQHAERVTASMLAVLSSHHDGAPAVLIGAAVQTFIELHQQDPAVHSAVGAHVAKHAGPGLEEDLINGAELVLAQILQRRQDELGGRDPQVLAFLLMRSLEGVVHAATRDQPALLDDPRFAQGLTDMMLAAVRTT